MKRSTIRDRLVITVAGTVAVALLPNAAAGAVPFRTAEATEQPAKIQAEKLNRGVISVHSANGNRVSWRSLVDDPAGVAFNVYRNGTKVNRVPLSGPTSFVDAGGPAGAKYAVRAVVGGAEQRTTFAAEDSLTMNTVPGAEASSRDVPLQIPPGGRTPSGENYTYVANDTSVGDLDGDGQYEIILKWDPTNAKDNAQSGYTGNVYLDAYKLNGTRLWRIDLGRNIRAGAHYTQFQVFDYDGDGKAEVAVKTADGTRSGTGQVIGNGSADHRNSTGRILAGPEFLSVFRGTDGAMLATANYQPPRGNVSSWGDTTGNRVDRFLAGTAYLDGTRPSIIMARGYYTRSVIAAWDFRNGALTQRWIFDSNSAGSQWSGKGNHQLSIADVDTDGRDEVLYGGDGDRRQRPRVCGRTPYPPRRRLPRQRLHPLPARARGLQAVGMDQRACALDGLTPAPARSSGARPPAVVTTAVRSPRTSGRATPGPRPGRHRSAGYAAGPTDGKWQHASRGRPTS